MKRTKITKWLCLLCTLSLTIGLIGCGTQAPTQPTDAAETLTGETIGAADSNASSEAAADTADTFVFTDSVGRSATLPKELRKIAPSGPLAQLVLYTACPDLLCGLAADFTEDARLYIDEKYWSLPKFGQFYGKNANLNMEALIAENPDVIVDIGQAKGNIAEDLDALSDQLGIPVVFIEATIPTMESAYQKLGELTGNTEHTDKLAAFCKKLLDTSSEAAAAIPEESRKTVYFAMGDQGFNTSAGGSIHADVIEQIGAVNAANIEVASGGGTSEVSLEQIYLWNPDFIITDSQILFDKLKADPAWQELDAVKNGNLYKVPTAPYSFMSNPPSVNRLIGIAWLAELVYPDYYEFDVKTEVSEFYKLFYHVELTEEELAEVLKDAQ